MTDTDNLNVFEKGARLPGGPNDTNPTARHEDSPVPSSPDPSAAKEPEKAKPAPKPAAPAPAPAPEK